MSNTNLQIDISSGKGCVSTDPILASFTNHPRMSGIGRAKIQYTDPGEFHEFLGAILTCFDFTIFLKACNKSICSLRYTRCVSSSANNNNNKVDIRAALALRARG
jgi:hypothetical protein